MSERRMQIESQRTKWGPFDHVHLTLRGFNPCFNAKMRARWRRTAICGQTWRRDVLVLICKRWHISDIGHRLHQVRNEVPLPLQLQVLRTPVSMSILLSVINLYIGTLTAYSKICIQTKDNEECNYLLYLRVARLPFSKISMLTKFHFRSFLRRHKQPSVNMSKFHLR